MCSFCFMVGKEGQVYALLGQKRQIMLADGRDPDSYNEISNYYYVDIEQCWLFKIDFTYNRRQRKVEVSPVTDLKKIYNGGLPIEEMPFAYMEKVWNFLNKNQHLILEAAKIKPKKEVG